MAKKQDNRDIFDKALDLAPVVGAATGAVVARRIQKKWREGDLKRFTESESRFREAGDEESAKLFKGFAEDVKGRGKRSLPIIAGGGAGSSLGMAIRKGFQKDEQEKKR